MNYSPNSRDALDAHCREVIRSCLNIVEQHGDTYTDLAPNIAKSGVFVYNVPEDSADYYLSVLKADTDDGYHLYAK